MSEENPTPNESFDLDPTKDGLAVLGMMIIITAIYDTEGPEAAKKAADLFKAGLPIDCHKHIDDPRML